MGKLRDMFRFNGEKKGDVDPAALTAVLTSAVALAGGSAIADGAFGEAAGKETRDAIQAVEKASIQRNAPMQAALEEQKMVATSRIIQARTRKGWGAGINLTGALATGIAVSQIGKKKRLPAAADTNAVEDRSRS
jgi:hypothetical protein